MLVNASYEPTEALSGKFGLFSPERREQPPRIVLSYPNKRRATRLRWTDEIRYLLQVSLFVRSCLIRGQYPHLGRFVVLPVTDQYDVPGNSLLSYESVPLLRLRCLPRVLLYVIARSRRRGLSAVPVVIPQGVFERGPPKLSPRE